MGYDFQTFDFRRSRYFQGRAATFVKNRIRKFFPLSHSNVPFINSLEKEKMNRSLLETVRRYRPDILLILTGEIICPETLKEIKKSNVVIANWFTDSVLDPYRANFIRETSEYYDYFFIVEHTDVLKHTNIKSGCVKTVPLGCDPGIHKTVELTEKDRLAYGCDVCFLGTVKHGREEILTQLTEFDLGIWGYWVTRNPKLEKYYRSRYVFGEEAVKLYNASKIALNITPAYGGQEIIFEREVRLFEISACGAFVLSPKTPYMDGLYKEGFEMVYYKDINDLKNLILYYLAHPQERELIAKRGQARSHLDHTYEKRLNEIFSIINKNG